MSKGHATGICVSLSTAVAVVVAAAALGAAIVSFTMTRDPTPLYLAGGSVLLAAFCIGLDLRHH